MASLMTRGLAVAAGLIFATAGGATVAAAAGTPTSGPTASPGSNAHHRLFRLPRLVGEVVSDSSSGGSQSAGQLVLKEPDGTTVTLGLATQTKAWKYHGFGVKPTSESPSAIPAGEVVVVAGRKVSGSPVAARILDLGFQAAG